MFSSRTGFVVLLNGMILRFAPSPEQPCRVKPRVEPKLLQVFSNKNESRRWSKIHSSTSSNSFFLLVLCARNVLLQTLDTARQNGRLNGLFNIWTYSIVAKIQQVESAGARQTKTPAEFNGNCRLSDRSGKLNLLGF